jgi:TIR domain
MADIFISYSHQDRAQAQAIHNLLEQERYSVTMDWDIPAGDFWRDSLDRQLQEASVVIVLWSRQSAASGCKESGSRTKRMLHARSRCYCRLLSMI